MGSTLAAKKALALYYSIILYLFQVIAITTFSAYQVFHVLHIAQDVELWSSPVPAGLPSRPVPAMPPLTKPGEDVSLHSDSTEQTSGSGLP